MARRSNKPVYIESCPNCQVVFGFSESDEERCYACGWPDNDQCECDDCHVEDDDILDYIENDD